MPQPRSVGIRDILGIAAALGLSFFLIATPARAASPSPTAEKPAKPKVEKSLQGPRLAQGAKPAKSNGAETDARAAHAALLAESKYPSAATCGSCHPQHYNKSGRSHSIHILN